MICPKCNIYMESKHYNGFDVNWCYKCEGVWVSKKVLIEILSTMHVNPNDVDFYERLKNVKFHSSSRACPDCKLQILSTYIVNNVEVEICPDCNGMYLDKGELKKVAPFAKKPRKGMSDEEILWQTSIDGERLFENNPTLNAIADIVYRIYVMTWI